MGRHSAEHIVPELQHIEVGDLAASGRRFPLSRDGSLESSPLEGEERVGFLVAEIGIAEEVARRVPPDRPVPPRP
jgi:hypothetical protein